VAEGQFAGLYKRSKRDAEAAALGFVARGLPLVVVNPSAPVGPWDRKPTPTGKMLLDLATGRMPAYVETGLNIVHVRDVAEGHVLAAERGKVGERYILGHQNMTLSEIGAVVAKLTGRRAPTIRLPYALAYATGFVSTKVSDLVTGRPPAVPLEAVKMAKYTMFFDPSKAVRELALPQTPVRSAFDDALEWFAKNGYLGTRRTERGDAWQSP
jgi:dihydroflavonol-4-reductase